MDVNNKSYIYVNIEEFDLKNIKIEKEENKDTYTITYNDNYFYLISDCYFNSYGISIDKNQNELKRISIILDDDNKNKSNLKLIIKEIYNKLKYKLNIDVYNPINTKYNTIYTEINNKSTFYEYIDNITEPKKISYNKLLEYNNFTFKITPIIFFKKLTIKNNILYFNFCLKSAVIKYDNCPFDLKRLNKIYNDNNNRNKDKSKINEQSSSDNNIITF
jgi:hypothetical protein